ncbi:MAG: sporulation protein YqfD [Clostridiales bacterium]|nr:sporulation protein YqfD [Roseburia sp.]MDD7638219.1 sporulation protein YqfD [Clostridiales bacterium]
MLLSLMKYAKGYVYVRITGYAPERFLNLCGNRDILIWNLLPCEDGYEFCISVAGFRQLKPILKKTRTKVRILRRVGAPFLTFRYRKRKLFGVGLLFFGMLLYYLSGFIWNIEINGNSYLSNEVILDFLKDEACTFGTKKSDINCQVLEEALRSRYSEVIWTSIKIYGTKMTVDIQENLLPEEQYEKQDDAVYDIVAAKDGVVTEIITRSGTPLVTAGTEVKKGDLLVSGCVEIKNDADEVVEYLYHSSDADIVGKVVYPYHDVIKKEYIATTPTEKSCKDYTLLIGEITFKNPFFHNPYEEYRMTTDTYQVHVTDNFYLPIWVTRYNYQEVKKQQKSHSEKEIRQIASKNLMNYLQDLEEKGIQIIGKNVIIKRTDKGYLASGTIEVYESIVSYQPTEIRNITSEERQNADESD